jgi:hypothetical protein
MTKPLISSEATRERIGGENERTTAPAESASAGIVTRVPWQSSDVTWLRMRPATD